MTELEEKVLKIINEIVDGVYISSLKILVDEDSFFLKLSMNQELSPLSIYYEGNESGFLRYIEKDLRARQIDRAKFYKLVKIDEDRDELITLN